VDLASIESRYRTNVWRQYGSELEPFVDQGLLIYDGAHLRLTRPGMLLANEVMAVFISSPVR
jgi:oxygen-independent coproporphyrinogen-3 oxidase